MDNIEEEMLGHRIIKIDVEDIMDGLVQKIVDEYGVESGDVRYIGKIKKLVFELPVLDHTLCNEVLSAMSEDDSCWSTGGGCICGLDNGHKGEHRCKKCGVEW